MGIRGRIDLDFSHLHAWAGPIEVTGGMLLILGLFTRATTFILCGEMAVAYFLTWAPRGFWPVPNRGELDVINCYSFLWLVFAGGGPWSLDALLAKRRKAPELIMKKALAGWESQVRSILRIVAGFLITQHGFRNAFGVLPVRVGRRPPPLMALDTLGSIGGYLELVGGVLLLFGLLTIPVAIILCLTSAIGYIAGPLSHPSPWPIRNGGEEGLVDVLVMIFFGLAGAGVWSIDALWDRGKSAKIEAAPAA